MMETELLFTDTESLQLTTTLIDTNLKLDTNIWDDDLIKIIKSMIILNPIERLSASEILYKYF